MLNCSFSLDYINNSNNKIELINIRYSSNGRFKQSFIQRSTNLRYYV